VAISLGFILGILACLLFALASGNLQPNFASTLSLKTEKVILPTLAPILSPSPVPAGGLFLTLNQPEDESITNQPKTIISGTTLPKANLAIIYDEGEAFAEAGTDGNFRNEIPLTGGANEITVTAFGENGEEATEIINIVYTTAEI